MQNNVQNIDIKAIRKGLNLNQTDFGQLIGASLRSVQMYEKGFTKPSADVLMKLLELDTHTNTPINNDPNVKIESLTNEVNLLKEKLQQMKDNFKMLYEQLLFLQNSFITLQNKNGGEKKKLG